MRLNIFNAFQNAPNQNTSFFLDDIRETVEDPLLESLSGAPSWRIPPEPMPLTSSSPTPDDNATGDIFHSEVTEVNFIEVDNFLASSQAASIFEDPHRDKRLIMEPVRDKHLEYRHGESQGLSAERRKFRILRGIFLLVECYMIIKNKGWKSLIGLLKERGKNLQDPESL
jgi:hypothetical protein